MNSISIFGTSSDCGKSTITFVIAKLLQDRGYSVAPFKAQNVSNNSKVADDGSEISIAQSFQAEVLGLKTSFHLNPILLKSGYKNSTNLIIEGKPIGDKNIREYYKEIDRLKPIVSRSFSYLRDRFDIVVCEGAGSAVELNLINKDLSNIYIASRFDTKVIIVADIEKGGVFASIWGTLNLLPKSLRKNVIGVIVNKFRGDRTLFDDGVKIIERDFNVPVLGVLPKIPLNIGFEDSQSLLNYLQSSNYKINIGVIKFPHISNYNDFEPLILDDEVNVDFIQSSIEAYDAIILPGTKKTIQDLRWLKKSALFDKLKRFKKPVFGICGGYQMMFEKIIDKIGIENSANSAEVGFGFVKGDVEFKKDKILKNKEYYQFGYKLKGFEIRHGEVDKEFAFLDTAQIKGTFVHSIFENDNFRNCYLKSINPNYNGYNFFEHKKKQINTFIKEMEKYIKLDKIIKKL